VDVAQERKGEARALRERFVAEGAVAADGEDGRAAIGELGRDLAQAAQLRASDAAEVIAVEDEHDVRAPPEIAQRDGVAACRRQAEVRSRLTERERRHGGECTSVRRSGLARRASGSLQQGADAGHEHDGQEHGGADHVGISRKGRHTSHDDSKKCAVVIRAIHGRSHKLVGKKFSGVVDAAAIRLW
jgi:hypothetical protein